MLISKRWEGVWKLVPHLMFDDESYKSSVNFMSFVDGSLLKNNPQVLERLHLKLGLNYSTSDINAWFQAAVYRSVREVRIDLIGKTLELPSCLSTCTTLTKLILRQLRIEVVPPWFHLPSLKTLHLLGVNFSGDESVASFLQVCPVLEDLAVVQTKVFSINAPTLTTCTTLKTLILQQLSIEVVPPWFRLPSLKTMHLYSVKFSGDESVASLVRICPVLEDLAAKQTKLFSINAPTLSTCITLKTLILHELSIKVAPPWFRLPSLKTLHLLSVKFSRDESVASLLRNCPVLEDLVVNQTKDDNVLIFNINVPTLRRLSIDNSKGKRAHVEQIHGFVIEAPSLWNLNIKDTFSNSLMFEDMPKVIKANIEVICGQSKKFMRSITSIKHLSLCSQTSKTPYPRGTLFFFLIHLELCTCSVGWWNLLDCILNDAPRLVSLKLKSQHSARHILTKKDKKITRYHDPWNKLECLSTHLEILEWRQYEGTEEERKVAAYILAEATRVRMATFSAGCRSNYLWMLRTVEKMHRVSKTCQLVLEETLM